MRGTRAGWICSRPRHAATRLISLRISCIAFYAEPSEVIQMLAALVLKKSETGGDSEAQDTGTTPLLTNCGTCRVSSLCIN